MANTSVQTKPLDKEEQQRLHLAMLGVLAVEGPIRIENLWERKVCSQEEGPIEIDAHFRPYAPTDQVESLLLS